MIKDVNGIFDDILFHLKLDKFYCIGVMNQLKMICYDLIFVHIKISYSWLNRQELLRKARERDIITVAVKKAPKYHIKNREFLSGKARKRYRNFKQV